MATNNIKSLKNIHTLEHLDGKIVKYSTITAQFPDIFVQRKRNTGELIISTDTDPYYGMHHIYAGGEHIAGGYGFATIKTRDDLTYIQETYNGIFNYLNNGYIYLGNAYTYMTDFANKSYTYVVKSLLDNSYTNIAVDNNLNKFIANNVTYTLEALDGTLYIKTDDKITLYTKYSSVKDSKKYEVIKQNNNSYVLLSNDFNDIVTPFPTDNTTPYIKFNNRTDNNVEYTLVTIYLRFQQFTNMKFGTENIKKIDYKIFDYKDENNIAVEWSCSKGNSNQFNDSAQIKNILDGNKIELNLTNIILPVFKNYNAEFTVEYVLDDLNTIYKSETFYFKWVNPILIFNTKEDKPYTYIIYNENNTYNIQPDINNIYNISYILLDDTLNKSSYIIQQYNTDYVTNLIVPFSTNKKHDFYISTDITKKANCEGGFAYEVNLPSKNNQNNKYSIYVSETQFYNPNLRFDINIK